MGRVASSSSKVFNNPNYSGKDSFCFNIKGDKPIIWIIDSGATDHMCGSEIKLSKQRVLGTPIKVHLPNSQTTTVKFVGDYKMNNNLTL